MPLDPKTHDHLRTLGIASGGSKDDDSPPLDLRTIPREKWDDYVCFDLLLPPEVAAYIAGAEAPLTRLEIDNLEERIITFYQIQLPFTIALKANQALLMKESVPS